MSTPEHDPASEAFAVWRLTLHGLDAATVRLIRDEEHRARWLVLDAAENVVIRIDLKRLADLERDRKGLRMLAKLATQVAQEIEEIQRGGGGAEGGAE